MNTSPITSYAILQVNWEQPGHHDYLDNYCLIVAEAVRSLPNEIITLKDLQNQLISHFGLTIPQNTIKTILKRLHRMGLLSISANIYTKNNDALEKINFRNIQSKVLQAHEKLISHLIDFELKLFNVNWNIDDAEKYLLDYLEDNQIALLNDLITKQNNSKYTTNGTISYNPRFLIAKYIEYIYETQSTDLDYLETIVKGNILANSIFLIDQSTYQKKFRDTSVIFDTPLIIFALGYAGEPRKSPISELIKLLSAYGAHLHVFRHSIEEVIGILTACADRVRTKQFKYSYGPSIEYFIEKGYSEVDIMMFIENLETDLVHLGISIIDKPEYVEHKDVIDEIIYSKFLQGKILYSKERPLERDVDSISAIYRLRKGNIYIRIEECKAIFVTLNKELAESTREYGEFKYQTGTAPLCVTDYEITTLVWLKDPTISPSLPRKRLIADSYASIQPDDLIWKKYLTAISNFEKQKKITSEQYFILRHSIQAKNELMEHIKGDEKVFVDGTILEILDSIQEKIKAEYVEKANKEAYEKEQALVQLDAERNARLQRETMMGQKEEERKNRIHRRAEMYYNRTITLLLVVMTIIYGYFTYATSSLGPLTVDKTGSVPNAIRMISIIIVALLFILQTTNLIWGFMPKLLLERLKPKLIAVFEEYFSNE
jgi:hypothetical protein